jgi:hypothetical protein
MQFLVDIADMRPDGFGADTQQFRNFFVPQSF